MKIKKGYEERRKEILDVAERLFHTKGYEHCTVNDILKEVDIAKGTFYYYFKSKEEVMDAIITEYNEIIINRVQTVLKNEKLSPEEKLLQIFTSMQIKDKVDSGMLNELHRPENALFHQKVLIQIVTALAPLLKQVIEDGMKQKIWHCRYPLEYMQIFLVAALTLTDEGYLEITSGTQDKLLEALISVLEKLLEVPSDTLIKKYMKRRN